MIKQGLELHTRVLDCRDRRAMMRRALGLEADEQPMATSNHQTISIFHICVGVRGRVRAREGRREGRDLRDGAGRNKGRVRRRKKSPSRERRRGCRDRDREGEGGRARERKEA